MSDGRDKLRVMIADDHYILRQGVRAMIQATADLSLVGEACNGREAVECYARCHPDVAILDVRMPVLDGPSAIREIRAEAPDARIIALSHYEGDDDIARCLDAGAVAYIFKRSVEDDLLDVIRAAAAGRKRIPREVKARLDFRSSRPVPTEREREVLALMARGQSNKQIAATLGLSVTTINTHVAALLAKLEANDRTEAVRIGLQRGLVHLD